MNFNAHQVDFFLSFPFTQQRHERLKVNILEQRNANITVRNFSIRPISKKEMERNIIK